MLLKMEQSFKASFEVLIFNQINLKKVYFLKKNKLLKLVELEKIEDDRSHIPIWYTTVELKFLILNMTCVPVLLITKLKDYYESLLRIKKQDMITSNKLIVKSTKTHFDQTRFISFSCIII